MPAPHTREPATERRSHDRAPLNVAVDRLAARAMWRVGLARHERGNSSASFERAHSKEAHATVGVPMEACAKPLTGSGPRTGGSRQAALAGDRHREDRRSRRAHGSGVPGPARKGGCRDRAVGRLVAMRPNEGSEFWSARACNELQDGIRPGVPIRLLFVSQARVFRHGRIGRGVLQQVLHFCGEVFGGGRER